VVIIREEPRQRLLALSLQLGDNLFRRGRCREAQRHFSLALSLAGDRADIQLRIDRCRPFLPPPPPPLVVAAPPPEVVVAPAPPVVVLAPPPPRRPRLVVFNFLVNCEPGLVPPAVGDWAADNLGACFGGSYEVIERGEVCWYMGRLGITMREVLNDPSSRLALAQALDVRFFLFGTIEQTHSLNVTTHLIDAQTGARTGTGMIHVRDHNEMKLRMNELARQVGAAPAEQARLARQGKDNEKALGEARQLLAAGSFTPAAAVARAALKKSPDDVALRAVQEEAEQKARQVALAEAQRREAAARKAEQAAAQARQRELARQAEVVRQKAEAEARAQGEAARRAQELQKHKAAEQLREQAHQALKAGSYARAEQALQGAIALKPGDDLVRELALVRAEQDKAARARAAQEQAQKEAELARQREAAQARVEAEHQKRDAEEAARRKAQQEKDQAEYARRIDQARQLLAQKQFDQAAGALQAARHLRATEETDRLFQEIQEAKALAAARQKGEQARAETERRLAQERARREQAEAEAKRKQQQYLAQLDAAQKALAGRHYDEAAAHFQEAGKLYQTDAVANGLKQAQELRDAEQRRSAEEKQRADRLQALLADGRKAADARQYDRALQSLREASRLAPGNAEVKTALARAEQAHEEWAARSRQQAEQEHKQATVRKILDSATAQAAARRYDDAARALQDALRIDPGNAEAMAALREIDRARTPGGTDSAALKKRQADYSLAMEAGRAAMTSRNYPGAVNAFTEALRLVPGDRDATGKLQEAQRLRDEAAAQARRREDFARLTSQGGAAMAARRYADAVQAYSEALKIQPGDAATARALRDAQQALDAQRNPPKPAANAPKPPSPQEEYAKAMQAAAAFDKQKKYADAVQAYRNALRWSANNAKAATGLRNAEYLLHMTEGEKLLAAKRFADAAREFEEALKLFPASSDAKNCLQKAKSGKP
jgi:hypothetical protein